MEKKITRRDMIKALIAGSGGIVAAGFVPEKWLKPVVKSGVLPVHAQASIQPTLVPDNNFVRGYGWYGDGILFASAYVSSEDFEYPVLTNVQNSYKLASPSKIPTPIDNPVEDVEVTLWINENKHDEIKTTDESGYVFWEIFDEQQLPNVLDYEGNITLKFEISGHFDTYLIIQEVDD